MQNSPQNWKSHQKQGRPTDDPQAHEKVLNITDYQRNLNQTCHETSITSHQSEWPSLKRLQTVNGGESAEKREPVYTVDGNVSWCCL